MTKELHPNVIQQVSTEQLSLAGLIETATRFSNAGETALARQTYQTWIHHNRNHPHLYVAHFNCSSLDMQADDRAAAIASLNEAIALNSDFVPAYINLGRIYEEMGAVDRAVALWQLGADRAAPVSGSAINYATTALTQIARVLSAAQQIEATEGAILRCLDINPRQPDIIEQYAALRLAQCKWPIATPSEQLDRRTLLGGINPLSMAAYTDDPLLQLASAYRYVKRSAWDGPHNWNCDRRQIQIDLKGRRLRVGYISSDLRDHAIGYLMAELFELHDKRNIEVFAYYCGPESNSALTNRIRSAVEHWIDIRHLSDDAAASQIAADGIDILVDVNGHTRDARTGVFARRPAPIQVNWLGYPGSMGSPYHQYLIADDWIIPESSEIYYSEKIVRLPCYQPNDRKREIAAIPSREDAGLPRDAFVFCCFNGTHKISRFTFNRWIEILRLAKDSVLWLLDTSEQTKKHLRDLAEQAGVSGSRLIFAPKMQNSHHLARYPLADLFLDSAPYGAHTTASDALWMGVPVLTLSGRSFASRVCGSLVRAAGLTDLVCTRPDEYIARAVALAGNRAEIEAYKSSLQANRNTCLLFNTATLVNHLEALYRSMCDEYCKGGLPQPDLTNLDAYFEAGIDHDHDSEEALAISNYHEMYRKRLKRLHLARPLHADRRLWTGDDIAAATGQVSGHGAPEQLPANTLRDLAFSLHAAGHTGGAILLLKQLVASNPSDIETLRQLASLLSGQGRTLECLETLLALKTQGAGVEILLDQIQAVVDPAIQRFNQCLAAEDIEQAATYADALAALLPGNVAALNAALSCNIALGRTSQAAQIAALLVPIDPSNEAARNVLAAAKADEKAISSSMPQFSTHPLIQLRDLYDQASLILCDALTEAKIDQVGQLLTSARHLDVIVPENTEWAGWEKHYRLALRAIDMSATPEPAPEPSDEEEISFTTASGKKLDWRGVQAVSERLSAKAVYFAAADRSYVDLYGRAYINSILEHSEISSIIILHVIGGAKELQQLAKSMGITSNRLIFAGDPLDIDGIKTKCFDAPPKGQSALPIAHLQSTRFLRVGALLQGLKLPVFVSDIDLILQRGVSDLLQKFQDYDLILNRNTESTNAGSRFTANLLLLNPTQNTMIFLQFLRGYLEKALRGEEVSRWIDQFGIMQAWHHLLRNEPNARIGYFDVTTDINNLMYPSYQDNPFRFLSLYHGFDMSTLPATPKSRRARPERRKKASAPGNPPARPIRLAASNG